MLLKISDKKKNKSKINVYIWNKDYVDFHIELFLNLLKKNLSIFLHALICYNYILIL